MNEMVKFKNYILLIFTFFIYSLSLLFSKMASMQIKNFFFVLFYGFSVIIMGVYAIFWQISLKRVSLNVAFPLKAITLIFSMILGYLIFNETITIKMIIGSLLIILGIIFIGKENE